MDDYSINSLTESKNEWCARLVNILTPTIIQGIKSIFTESNKICLENDEQNKYLMTFQNLLSQIPQWNSNTIEKERKRIEQVSGCKYLEELVTCVHIIQLKALTCIRVGQKQKKIDIDIPSIDKFIHQIYINTARRLYTNIYLFENDIYPLQMQKNNKELENLIKDAILTTIRDNIPVEKILHAYMDETEEEEVISDVKLDSSNNITTNNTNNTINNDMNDNMNDKINHDMNNNNTDINIDISNSPLSIDNKLDLLANQISNNSDSEKQSINFSNVDNIIEPTGIERIIDAPKDLETLDKISNINNEKRKNEENEENESEKLNIGDDIKLNIDTIDLSPEITLDDNILLDDIEIL